MLLHLSSGQGTSKKISEILWQYCLWQTHHGRHEIMRSVIENALFEGLGHVVKITQPDGGEVAPVQTEDGAQLVMMGIKALQGSVS